jgi:hypothetical protein
MLPALLLLLHLPLAQLPTEDAGAMDGDAGAVLPDADGGTLGEGGADRTVQEADDSTGRVPTTCRQSLECERGFSCVDGRCAWSGTRSAAGPGCLGASAVLLWLPALGFLLGARGRRR